MRQVEITGIALEATTGAPLVVLQETDEPHRTMPIFIGGTEAASIGLALAGETPDRPLTHDLMADLVGTPLFHRAVTLGESVDDRYADALVDAAIGAFSPR